MADVFISYSSKHRDLTEHLAALLEREGYSVWWDHALESWASFQDQIDRELAAARVIVVIWSEGAASSLYVKAEANKAIDARKLVNVRAPGFPHAAIPTPYNAMHIDQPDLDELDRVLRSIRSVWSGAPYTIKDKPLHEHYRETFGRSLFDPKRTSRVADPSRLAPSELLQARYEIVPFIDTPLGLAAEMEAWCADTKRATAGRLVHGAGGYGKTRLMIEVAKRLRAKGWLAGFVEPVATPGDLQEARQREQAFEQLFASGDEPGVLLIFDYAEGRQEEVAEVVALLREREAGRPVRLVLLARGDGWWEAFYEQRLGARQVFGLAGKKLGDVRLISDLPEGQARLDLFVETVKAFEPIMADMAAAGRFPGYDPHHTAQAVLTERLVTMKTHEDYARPLAIQMEALLYLASATPKPGETSTADLLREVLHLEEAHWGKLLGDVPRPLRQDPDRKRDLARGVTQVTAVQGVATGDPLVRLLMADGFYGDRRKAPVDVDPVRRDLTHIYARGHDRVAHLEPDLVGEHLVAGTADTALIDGCLAWIATLPGEEQEKKRDELLRVLVRATRREHGEAHIKNASALLEHVIAKHKGLIEALTFVGAATPGLWLDHLSAEALAAIDRVLPEHSTARLEFALAVLERRVALMRAELRPVVAAELGDSNGFAENPTTADHLSQFAGQLNNLGLRRGATGRREQALAATEEALALRRALAARNPDAFTSDLAMSLNNLGLMLADLGRREQALAANEEALALYRALAARNLDAFTPGLATSLNNLGIRLADLGRREQALAATEEALALRRALAARNPDAFTPDLAGSLNNLGLRLADLGRGEEALEVTQEAVHLRRALTKENPDAFTPSLAGSLDNLGIRLADLGRRQEALEATQEAVGFRRALAKANPDAFTPNLAMSLDNLGTMLADLGRRQEALEVTQEAVGHYRALAKANPDAFTPNLAMSLNNLGNRLAALGRRQEALEATQEAVGFRRALAKANPDAFTPDLAGSLSNLGAMLAALGRRQEAAGAAHEGLTLLAPFVEGHPAAFGDLARALASAYTTACVAAGRAPDEALLTRIAEALDDN